LLLQETSRGRYALCRAFDAIDAIAVDQHAAIDCYPFTGNETGLIGRQEDGGCRDLVRQAVAAEQGMFGRALKERAMVWRKGVTAMNAKIPRPR
jgi:hypothetical protein